MNAKLKSGERETHWRREIRTALHVPDEVPSLDPITHNAFSPTEGVRVKRVSYGTQFGMRIPGILYLPDPMPEEKIPGLIVMTGHGGEKHAWYAMCSGMLYAKGGASVLTYDPTDEHTLVHEKWREQIRTKLSGR